MTELHNKMNDFMDGLVSKCPTIFNASNSKFLVLVRSRLIEEGIGVELSTRIANALTFDLSNINEDDDLIAQAAGKYADFAAKVYDRMTALNMHKSISDAMITKYFTFMYITF